jgi:hypothetical protein
VDGQVESAGGQECGGWVEAAVEEEGVDGDGEEVGEGGKELGGLAGAEGWGVGHGLLRKSWDEDVCAFGGGSGNGCETCLVELAYRRVDA